MTSVILLAGGLGKRLGGLTKATPKPLIKINKIPFIKYQLDMLKKQGFRDIVICAGYLNEMFYDQIGNGKEYDINIKYSIDFPKLLGTGGAIKKALPLVTNNFFIMYADSYLRVNLCDVLDKFKKSKKNLLMTIFKNENNFDKSNIEIKEDYVIYNKKFPNKKMNYIDYGLSIANKNAFTSMFNDKFDYSELLELESLNKNIIAFEVKKRFYEIGTLSGLKEFEKFIKNNNIDYKLF